MTDFLSVLEGDAVERLRTLETGSVQCVVTSPPYWGLRDYGHAGQIGLEKTPPEYVEKLVVLFREVRRVLANDGTLWLNLGDSYAGSGCGWGGGSISESGNHHSKIHGPDRPRQSKDQTPPPGCKAKDLVGIPWQVAFALRADGWYLRSDIIWSKPNPMPESVTDRPTKAHEYLFLLTKSQRYYYDAEAIAEQTDSIQGPRPFGGAGNGKQNQDRKDYFYSGDNGTRNKRSVWSVNVNPYSEAHFATYPPDLIKPCILAGSRIGDTILDPFGGSGTTGMVALELGRKAVLIELNPSYVLLIHKRCSVTLGLPLSVLPVEPVGGAK